MITNFTRHYSIHIPELVGSSSTSDTRNASRSKLFQKSLRPFISSDSSKETSRETNNLAINNVQSENPSVKQNPNIVIVTDVQVHPHTVNKRNWNSLQTTDVSTDAKQEKTYNQNRDSIPLIGEPSTRQRGSKSSRDIFPRICPATYDDITTEITTIPESEPSYIISSKRKKADKSDKLESEKTEDLGDTSSDDSKPLTFFLKSRGYKETISSAKQVKGSLEGSDASLKNNKIKKWKQNKYTRASRNRRRRENIIRKTKHQLLVTNYVKHLDRIEFIMKQNNDLKKILYQEIPEFNTKDTEGCIPTFLKILNEAAKYNMKMVKNNKFSDDLLQFSVYLFIIGGRLLCESLYANLKKSLPSLSTVTKTISATNNFEEGVLRELNAFLEKRMLPKIIWISEDATRITGRIQYDPTSDRLVGFVSPIGKNGLPKKINLKLLLHKKLSHIS